MCVCGGGVNYIVVVNGEGVAVDRVSAGYCVCKKWLVRDEASPTMDDLANWGNFSQFANSSTWSEVDEKQTEGPEADWRLVATTEMSEVLTPEDAWAVQQNLPPGLTTLLSFKIFHQLWLYAGPVLLFGGGTSNILAIVVLRSHKFQESGTAFLLTALAVADLTVLLTNVLRHWIVHLSDFEIDIRYRGKSDPGCRIHTFFSYFSLQWSAWTLVLVAAERAVSVWCPFKAKVLCSRKRIIIAWLVMTAAVAAVNCPILIKFKGYIQRIPLPNNTVRIRLRCTAVDTYFLSTVLYWTSFAMHNAAPGICIFLLNVLIVARLARPQIDRQNDANAKKAMTSVTTMLLAVSVIFLMTTTPIVTYYLGIDTFFKTASTDVYVRADQLLTQAACILVAYVNNSINFLLYCLSGARFRQAMREMFCGVKKGDPFPGAFNQQERYNRQRLDTKKLSQQPNKTAETQVKSTNCNTAP